MLDLAAARRVFTVLDYEMKGIERRNEYRAGFNPQPWVSPQSDGPMISRKKLIVAAGLAALACLALGVLAMLPERAGVTWRNCDRLRKGMTATEVEGILGKPPQTITFGGIHTPKRLDLNGQAYDHAALWSNTELDIIVYFDEEHRVVSLEGNGPAVSLLDKIRRWLHLH